MNPKVVAIAPPPELLTASPGSLELRFDRAMDRRRGRVRLVWGRISAHFVNAGRAAWRWSLRDPELTWSPDGRQLRLALPPRLVDGFRVRVEWSDLADPDGNPPAPCEPGGTVSYVLVVARSGPLPPLGLACTPGSSGVLRPDGIVELYADAPVGAIEPERWRLDVDGAPQSFVLRSNRNPPDWIFLHPTGPLPLGRATLTIPADALRGTADQSLDAPWSCSWTVAGEVVRAEPHPEWSEPPPGFAGLPRRNPRFALRFADRPVLVSPEEAAQDITLQASDGRVLAANPSVFNDPTPGHYRSLVLAFDAELPPDIDVSLAWSRLSAHGGSPGAVSFRTGSPRPIAPLANAASLFATPRGSFLQAHASVSGPVRSVRAFGEGWSQELAATGSRGFTPAEGEVKRSFVTPTDAPPLPESPGLRDFVVELVDDTGPRALPGVAFDFGPRAVTELSAAWEHGLRVRWSVQTPEAGDAVHVCALRTDGQPLWSGLFATTAEQAYVPAAWIGDAEEVLLQLWLVRARPEDDLWDFFVTETATRSPR